MAGRKRGNLNNTMLTQTLSILNVHMFPNGVIRIDKLSLSAVCVKNSDSQQPEKCFEIVELWQQKLSNYLIIRLGQLTGLIIKKNQYSYHHLSLEWKKISYLHVETTKASNTSVFFVCVECFCCKQALGPSVTHLVHLATRLVQKFAPLFHPIRSKAKPNRHSRAHVFPRFVSATWIYFKFCLVPWIVCVL